MSENIKDLVFISRNAFCKFLQSIYFSDGDSLILRVKKNSILLGMLADLDQNLSADFSLEGYELRVYKIKDEQNDQKERYRLSIVADSEELRYFFGELVPEEYKDFLVE